MFLRSNLLCNGTEPEVIKQNVEDLRWLLKRLTIVTLKKMCGMQQTVWLYVAH